jgi:membrane protein CcdC involved in cytochrome C biogenesis
VAQALLTAVFIGLAGLVTTSVLGLRGTDISRHISYGIFSTMVTLLAHSMMMFYLIGKGKAVKDAMAEHSVTGDYYRRIALARKPVFSIGTLAMAVTMVAAIMGASVDTGVLPPIVHATIAYGAIVCNLAAVKIEITALLESSRIVAEVNRRLDA